MKKLNVEQMENIQGGIFWGTETTCQLWDPYYDEYGNPYYLGGTKCEDFYIFWIRMSHNCYPVGDCN